jgi:hypothetical protein
MDTSLTIRADICYVITELSDLNDTLSFSLIIESFCCNSYFEMFCWYQMDPQATKRMTTAEDNAVDSATQVAAAAAAAAAAPPKITRAPTMRVMIGGKPYQQGGTTGGKNQNSLHATYLLISKYCMCELCMPTQNGFLNSSCIIALVHHMCHCLLRCGCCCFLHPSCSHKCAEGAQAHLVPRSIRRS